MSAAKLPQHHKDYDEVKFIVDRILAKFQTLNELELEIGQLFRTAIDEVIDAPRTNRFTLGEIEQTEKTYLGTKIEILLRNKLGFEKGKALDFLIDGVECDVKNTVSGSWSIPEENINRPAILLKQDEDRGLCDFGVGILKQEYLNKGKNKDSKTSLAAKHRDNDIWWLLKNYSYPKNFWHVLPITLKQEIMSAGAGTAKVAALFELVQETPISRTQIQAIAQQHDYMKRVRRNGGARDILAPKGIAILWGKKDKKLISLFGLGTLHSDEFISYAPRSKDEAMLLREKKHID